MAYRILADITMTAHLLFLAYIVVGGFLAWRRPRTWFLHAAVVVYGLVIELVGFVCPLTPLEDHWRRQAGESGLKPTGFVDTYIEGVVYPGEHARLVQAVVAVVVLISWIGLAVRLRRRRAHTTHAVSHR